VLFVLAVVCFVLLFDFSLRQSLHSEVAQRDQVQAYLRQFK
jgi:hypothetical protein